MRLWEEGEEDDQRKMGALLLKRYATKECTQKKKAGERCNNNINNRNRMSVSVFIGATIMVINFL